MESSTVHRLGKLYSLAKTGKVKEWITFVVQGEYPEIHTVHGYIDGKKQLDVKKIRVGKNLGRANETTALEQAISQAKSSWNKKKDNNYFTHIPSKDELVKLPMLALEFSKASHNIVYPCYAQPKLNGIRCFAKKGTNNLISFTTRRGKKLHVLQHLYKDLNEMMDPGDIFDGELYNHSMGFQQIVKAVKREKSLSDLTKEIEFHIYDYADEDMDFEDRIDHVYKRISDTSDTIKRVSTKEINNFTELMEYHSYLTGNGYEGTIVRNKKGKYLFQHRSKDLIKLKDFIDEECEIIGGSGGQGRSENECTFECITAEGVVFSVRCVGEKKVREEQLVNLNSYIGKMLTVKYQNLSELGVPIFPIGIVVRNYE